MKILTKLFNVMLLTVTACLAQTPSNLPRTGDGKPNLNGIWQALSTAAWGLEDHNCALHAPGGQSVVDGGAIPYQTSALDKKKENFQHRRRTIPPKQHVSCRAFPGPPTCRIRSRSSRIPSWSPSDMSSVILAAPSLSTVRRILLDSPTFGWAIHAANGRATRWLSM